MAQTEIVRFARFACGFCFLPEKDYLKMKGLCYEDVERNFVYDFDYYIYGQKNGKPQFRYVLCMGCKISDN